jgi:hypothetical protein
LEEKRKQEDLKRRTKKRAQKQEEEEKEQKSKKEKKKRRKIRAKIYKQEDDETEILNFLIREQDKYEKEDKRLRKILEDDL